MKTLECQNCGFPTEDMSDNLMLVFDVFNPLFED